MCVQFNIHQHIIMYMSVAFIASLTCQSQVALKSQPFLWAQKTALFTFEQPLLQLIQDRF